jgi:hypothetical protein
LRGTIRFIDLGGKLVSEDIFDVIKGLIWGIYANKGLEGQMGSKIK